MPKRSTTIAIGAAAAVVVIGGAATAIALSGSGGGAGDAGDGETTVTVRLWDEQVEEAYEESFDAFEEENPDIDVEIEHVAYADYFDKLRTDVAGGSADDIFWVNNSYFGAYADNGNLLNIDETLGAEAKRAWEPKVVEQFTRDGALWGVPQLTDAGIALYYNRAMLDQAGIAPEQLNTLTWSPDAAQDSFLPVLQKLTRDAAGKTADAPGFDPNAIAQYGFNASNDLNAIYLQFIGSNGGTYQDGDEFTFDDPKSVEAFQYIVDLINEHHVAPSAADTNEDGDFARNQFLQGKMALFESGTYNLKNIADSADFDWGVALIPSSPAGRVSVTNGIVAAGNAATEHPEATAKVLEWLGSEEGNSFVGASGSAIPAVVAAQQTFRDYYADQGVDIAPFFDVIDGSDTIPAPRGANYGAAFAVFKPILDEVFLGRTPVQEGLEKAVAESNEAIR
ncbi:ABC transporter substrate-binding protein [Planctomonas deserti]|uniref:ABC transporter substrate-binding protein n=1 Tax=Planctomonas deserti TaxID=2144185 RepID=UPI000D34E48A|nr:sugar ABC transporter substrate-binding protein [Planctomonas deserti]